MKRVPPVYRVPPNIKKVRKVAGNYARTAAIHRKLSEARQKKPLPTGRPGLVSHSPGGNFRQTTKRLVVDTILDRRHKDSIPWRQELRNTKKATRLLRKSIRDMRNPKLPSKPSNLS